MVHYKKLLHSFNVFLFLCVWHKTTIAQNQTLEQYFEKQHTINYTFLADLSTKNNAYYELRIKQPIDHNNLTQGYFEQRVFLNHKGFDKKMLMATEGYAVTLGSDYELAELLEANQLDIEHRYFGNSVPNTDNFEYLNLKQSCADLHHIHELLAPIYKQKWISSGISKGGTTSLFYKYFYPNDVTATVAYVAPVANSTEDKRVYHFLDTVGSRSYRKTLKKFQINLFKNRKTFLPLFKQNYTSKGFSFNYLGFEKAFEYAVLEFPFAFWQWGEDSTQVPSKKEMDTNVADYFLSKDPIALFSDQYIVYFEPHYYQAATEMGYYGYNIKPFKRFLKTLSTTKNASAIFTPNHQNLVYNTKQYADFLNWVKKEGNHIIYIYGGIDPWSACAITPSNTVDAKYFMLQGKHHGNARIKNMTIRDKEIVLSSLNEWLKNAK